MRRLLTAVLLFAAFTFAHGQAVRFDLVAQTTQGSGQMVPMLALPGTAISFYTGCTTLPCTTPATTFTDQSGSTPCPSNAQVVYQLTNTCIGFADTQGNFGGWFTPGIYQYTITVSGHVYGPYNFTAASSSAGGGVNPGTPNKPLAGYPTAAASVNPFSPQTDSTQTRFISKLPRIDVTHSDFAVGCANGADPTGVLDSTCAILNAIAYAATQPVIAGVTPVLYFPAGTYRISSTLRTTFPISYMGDAEDQSVIFETNATANAITMAGINGNPTCGQQSCGVDIQNLTVQGNGPNTTGSLVELDNVTGLRMVNVKLFNSGGRGLVINNSERGSYINVNIQFVRWPIIMSGASNEVRFFNNNIFGGSALNAGSVGGQFCYNINCVAGNFPAANTATAVAPQWTANNNQNVGDFISAVDSTGINHNFRLSAGGSVVSNLWVPCQSGATQPAFNTVAVGGTIADNSCTWTDVGLATILHPDYHSMVILNGVDIGWYGGSLKTTQYEGCFNLMAGGGEGVVLASFYCEGFNGVSPNPAVQVNGGLDEFPLNISSPLSPSARVIPVTTTTWFPRYYTTPTDPNLLGSTSFETYTIYPPDANANSTASSICSIAGAPVLQNQFENIAVNGGASDNNIYVNTGATGRFFSGSTAPNTTQWCAGSYIRRTTTGNFSGLKILGSHINSSNLSASGYVAGCGDLQFGNLCGDILLQPAFNGKDIPYPVASGTGLRATQFQSFLKLDTTSLFRGSDESVGQGYIKSGFSARVLLEDANPPSQNAAQSISFSTLQGYQNGISTMQAIYSPAAAPQFFYWDPSGRAVETDQTYAKNVTSLGISAGVEAVLNQFSNETCDGDIPATGTFSNLLTCTMIFGTPEFIFRAESNTSGTYANIFSIPITGINTGAVAGTFAGTLGSQIALKNTANTWTANQTFSGTNTFSGSNNFTGTNPLTINTNPVPGFTSTTPGGTCTPNGFIPVVINGVTIHIATCS